MFEGNRKNLLYVSITFILLFVASIGGWFGASEPQTFDIYSENYMMKNFVHDTLYPENNTGFIEIYDEGGDNLSLLYFEDYYSGTAVPPEGFTIYVSAIAMHAEVYVKIIKTLKLSPASSIWLFRNLNSILFALVLTALVVWVCGEFGRKMSYFFTVFFAFFAPGLMVFARNLYWVGWSFILPFVAMLYIARYAAKKKTNNTAAYMLAFAVPFFTLFVRFLCSFEFMSTLMLSVLLPFIYYFLKKAQKIKQIVLVVLLASAGAIAAVVVAMLVYRTRLINVLGLEVYEIVVKGVFSKHVVPIDSGNLLWSGLERLSITKSSVVSTYVNMVAFQIFGLEIKFKEIFLIVVLQMFVAYLLRQKRLFTDEQYGLSKSLFATFIISLAAPLSWHILATHHSWEHPHINFVLWYIPSMFFAVMFILLVVKFFVVNRFFSEVHEINC